MALLAAYNFDESSGDFLDVTSGGHNIPLGANGARGAGHTGNALTKISTGMPVLADPAIGQTAHRTVMFWLLGTGTTWWVRWNADALGSGAWGILNLSGFVCVQARDGSGALLSPRPQVALPGDGLWHHYAATYDGSTVRLFVDGTQVSSGALAGGLYASANRIDLAEWSTAATFMDDLRIFDTALTQPDIATMMTTPVTASSESHAGSVTLAASTSLPGAGVKAATRAAGLTAGAAVNGSGGKAAAGPSVLAATGAVGAVGARASTGSAALSATVVAAVTGVHAGAGETGLPSTSVLAASGTSARFGSVTLSATARLSAVAVGDEGDITVTATLAPQLRPAVSVGPRRWAASLEAQP